MKATVVTEFGPPDVLVYRDWPKPEPKAGQVLIRTYMVGVNYADVHLRAGRGKKAAPPLLPGMEAAGEIVALGEGVDHLQVGQRVTAYTVGGSYAEFVLAQANLTYPIPDMLHYAEVSCIGSGITAYNVVHMVGKLSKSDVVVIHSAAGGVGSFCVQLARLAGARLIIGTVGSEDKLEVVGGLEADAVINYRTKEVKRYVDYLTKGKGADLILDSRGGKECEKSLGYLADFGRMVIFGQSGGTPAFLQSNTFYKRNQAILGYSSGHYRRRNPEGLQHAATNLLELLTNRSIQSVVGGIFTLPNAAKAHRLLESRTSMGKFLLEVIRDF